MRRFLILALAIVASCSAADVAAPDASGCPDESVINPAASNAAYIGCYKLEDSVYVVRANGVTVSTIWAPVSGVTLVLTSNDTWTLSGPTPSSGVVWSYARPDSGIGLSTGSSYDQASGVPPTLDAITGSVTGVLAVGASIFNGNVHAGTDWKYTFVRVR